jgi:deoxycytidylate deaminase
MWSRTLPNQEGGVVKDLSTHKIEYFRKITKAVASGSRCLSRQVGAVIVKDKRILNKKGF